MKTTVDHDGENLRRVVELTGLKRRKEGIDFALSQAERLALKERRSKSPRPAPDSK